MGFRSGRPAGTWSQTVTREGRGLRTERLLVIALTALITIAPLVSLAAATPVAIAIVVLTIVAWRLRALAATSVGIFSVACVVLGIAGIGPQQVVFSVAFVISALIVWRVPWLREATVWFQRGAFDKSLLAFAAGIAGLAAVYGVLLGALRRRAGGLLAPWTAHVLTDLAIAGIVLALVRS